MTDIWRDPNVPSVHGESLPYPLHGKDGEVQGLFIGRAAGPPPFAFDQADDSPTATNPQQILNHRRPLLLGKEADQKAGFYKDKTTVGKNERFLRIPRPDAG